MPDLTMTFDAYSEKALTLEKTPGAINGDKELVTLALKTAIATGRLLNLVKKGIFGGKEISAEQVGERAEAVEDAAGALIDSLYAGGPTEGPILVNPRLLHAAIGQFEEQTEIMELLLKQINGETLDPKLLAAESGDSWWYKALEADEITLLTGKSAAVIQQQNLDKLFDRKDRDALFTTENRDAAAEARVLS